MFLGEIFVSRSVEFLVGHGLALDLCEASEFGDVADGPSLGGGFRCGFRL